MSAAPSRVSAGHEKLASLADLEKDYIRYVLGAMKFNLKKAAGVLGISRTTLYNKMKRYGIGREKGAS
jgi:DNA-binding NtrC family response regulator